MRAIHPFSQIRKLPAGSRGRSILGFGVATNTPDGNGCSCWADDAMDEDDSIVIYSTINQ